MNNSPLKSPVSKTLMYSASFLLVLMLGALLLQVGFPARYIGLLMISFLIGGYLFSGIVCSTMQFPTYLTANRTIRSFSSGQSLATGMVSSGIFIFLAGQIYGTGVDALASFSGWILGAALITVLFASAITRSKTTTLPSLIHSEKGAKASRFTSVIIIILACSPLLILQFTIAGMLTESFFGMQKNNGIFLMAFTIGSCLLLGGIQSLTFMRMLAYPVIAIAFITPVAMIAYKFTGNPFPQFAYGTGALQPIMEIDREILAAGFDKASKPFSLTSSSPPDFIAYLSIMVCLACGLAAMPHLLQHFTTIEKPLEARKSSIWGMALLILIITAVPAYAAFFRLDIYTILLGLQLSDLPEDVPWLFNLSGGGRLQAIAICGEFITSLDDAITACGKTSEYFLAAQDITVNPSLMVLTSAILNDLPDMATWLLATGALLAVWSTGDGLALSMANILSNDGYVTMFKTRMPQVSKLFISRVCLILFVTGFGFISAIFSFDPQLLFEAGFALSAAAIFPALVMRIWNKNSRSGFITIGMITGFGLTVILSVLILYGIDFKPLSGDELQITLSAKTTRASLMPAGLIGLMASFAIMFAMPFIERIFKS